MNVTTSQKSGDTVRVIVTDEHGRDVATGRGKVNEAFSFKVNSPSLWSPDSPTLYVTPILSPGPADYADLDVATISLLL